jgi:hypothetical protein
MISWLIIIILVAIGILAIKMNHLKHRFFIIFIILLALFFYASITFVASKNNISLNTYDGFLKAIQIYGGWLVNLFGNFKSLTGNAIKMDWSSTNSSFFDKNNNSVNNSVDTPVKNSGQASIRLAKK